MVLPKKITNYNRTMEELEEFLLFAILVAGKKAHHTAHKLERFLKSQNLFGVKDFSPFDYIAFLISGGCLEQILRQWRIGQYHRVVGAFTEILRFRGEKIKNVTAEELESIPGIGPKTARFFVLHSQPGKDCAVLDTHILSWMRELGIPAPKSTPTGKKYRELEQKFLKLAREKNMSAAELDLEIWKLRSTKK